MAAGGDKQEKPTAKRVKDAKEKGQVARSKELGAAVGLVAAAGALAWFGARLAREMAVKLATDLASLDRYASAAITPANISGAVLENVGWLTTSLLPLTGTVAVVAIGGYAIQGGIAFAPKALTLHWDRLAPSQGLQKFSPSKSGMEVLRAVLALVALALVTMPVVRDLIARAPALVALTPTEAAAACWREVWRLIWRGALVPLAPGAAGYLRQRFSWMKNPRIGRPGVRDEMKQQDGNPEVKSRVRRVQREMARARMMSQVKTATVVVTNPTHYAIALTYNRARMAAPVVVAIGVDAMAARIRAVARDAGVPIIENPPLARALYAAADIGDAVPANLFAAVAEILAHLVRIRQLVL